MCKSPKKDSNIYDINNFVVQNFISKIIPKEDIFKIQVPIYQELPDDFYKTNKFNSSKEIKKFNIKISLNKQEHENKIKYSRKAKNDNLQYTNYELELSETDINNNNNNNEAISEDFIVNKQFIISANLYKE